jgi:hypothetical protein
MKRVLDYLNYARVFYVGTVDGKEGGYLCKLH